MPFDEDEKDKSVWFLDHDYLENKYHMFKKVRLFDILILLSVVIMKKLYSTVGVFCSDTSLNVMMSCF